MPGIQEDTRPNSWSRLQLGLNGAFAVIMTHVKLLLTHTHQQESSILQAAPSISERSNYYKIKGAKINLPHFTVVPGSSSKHSQMFFLPMALQTFENFCLSQSSFLQTEHHHILLGVSSPALLLIFLRTQRESSSGYHRTRSGPNHKTDTLFLSIPTFWCVRVLVYQALLYVTSSCSTVSMLFHLLATWPTHDISHCMCPLPAEQTALDRRQCSVSSLQFCISPCL